MGHVTSKGYLNLQKRLNDSPQGAPESDALFKILEILFTEKEANLVSVLPIRFFTVKTAAEIWKKSEKQTKKILDTLADKGLLLDAKRDGTWEYILAPTMAGFFEFSLMRTDGKFNRKVLSELYYQYINVEDDFVAEVLSAKPAMARPFVHENTVKSEILDYEKASKVVETASCITVGDCYCRHKMEHLGKVCNMPQKVCLTFNGPAESLSRHGVAKKISKKKAMAILEDCKKKGLVQIGDNVQNRVGWICNCCSCCCEALLAYKEVGCAEFLKTNYFASINKKKCVNCNVCVKKCPVDAISETKKVSSEVCIGCGVCVNFCRAKALEMKKRDERVRVPFDGFERYILTAIDKGKLQNLIFDNYVSASHAFLRKFVGLILNLKPVKMLLANEQLQSKYLAKLIHTKRCEMFAKVLDEKDPDYSHPELK